MNNTKESKHTPGPWFCTENDGSFVRHVDNNRIQIGSPLDYIAEIIDYGGGDGENQNDAEQEANARLIAAAPDMLEALKEVIDNILPFMKPDPAISDTLHFQLIEKLSQFKESGKLAIAKATNTK